MKQSKADTCVFRKVLEREVTLIVCVHVDDLVVTAKDKETFDAFFAQLKKEFELHGRSILVSWVCVRA